MNLDDVLAELRIIRATLDTVPEGDPSRLDLEARRAYLQHLAAEAADATRNPEAVAAEVAHLERRLAELDGQKVSKSWIEHRRWINDPSAYSHHINRKIAENQAAEREQIERRLERLRRRLREGPQDPP